MATSRPARYGAFEHENQPLLSHGPAVVSVGEGYRIGVHFVHLIPILSAIDRVVHSGWPNRECGGTGSVGHDRDTPAVSSGTVAAFLPRTAAVVGIGGIAFHHLRMIVVATDNHQAVGVRHGN